MGYKLDIDALVDDMEEQSRPIPFWSVNGERIFLAQVRSGTRTLRADEFLAIASCIKKDPSTYILEV